MPLKHDKNILYHCSYQNFIYFSCIILSVRQTASFTDVNKLRIQELGGTLSLIR